MQKNEVTDAIMISTDHAVCENDPYKIVILHKITMAPYAKVPASHKSPVVPLCFDSEVLKVMKAM